MATAKEMLNSALEDDVTLAAILTGGIFDPDDMFRPGLTPKLVPYDTDGVTILPFATTRWQSSSSYGPRRVAAERGSVEVYVYADVGYATIETAISRIKTLLNDTYIFGASDRRFVHFKSATISGDLDEKDLSGAPMKFIRFQITQTRR
jgi:hypothetical protein